MCQETMIRRALERGAKRDLRASRRPRAQLVPQTLEGTDNRERWAFELERASKEAMARDVAEEEGFDEVWAAVASEGIRHMQEPQMYAYRPPKRSRTDAAGPTDSWPKP